MRRVARILLLITVIGGVGHSAGAPCDRRECIPATGYVFECGAKCGRPGRCESSESESDYCMLSAEGYGCHDGADDPCCCTLSGF